MRPNRVAPVLLLLWLLSWVWSMPVQAEGPSLTLGYLPFTTHAEHIVIRGTAPRGQIAAIAVNGQVQLRVIAGPSMAVYNGTITLAPGPNRISVALEGTEIVVMKLLFRITAGFTDLEEHRARQDIEMLATLGMVDGVDDDRFGPDLQLTRSQYAKLMVNALGLPPVYHTTGFGDQDSIPEWAVPYVATAAANGLLTGYADGTFRPDAFVTHTEMAVIAVRGLRLLQSRNTEGGDARGTSAGFADQGTIPGWAQAEVTVGVTAGLIGEYWGETFGPDEAGTRARAAAIARRLWSVRAGWPVN